jgi:Restriction endonuclease NaeI
LLRIPPHDVDLVLNCSPHGAKRLDMLFRLAQQRIISRTVVATVAQQEDYMRRVRGNGGSRGSLQPEGIVILGDYRRHRGVAEQLRLPIPAAESGESVSVRLARRCPHHEGLPFVTLDAERWVVALPDDPPGVAPRLSGTKA